MLLTPKLLYWTINILRDRDDYVFSNILTQLTDIEEPTLKNFQTSLIKRLYNKNNIRLVLAVDQSTEILNYKAHVEDITVNYNFKFEIH